MDDAQDRVAGASPPAAEHRPTFRGLADDVRAAFGARAHLLELEAKQAAWSAAYMIGFAVAAALLAVLAYLILVAGLMTLAIRVGVPWWLAVLVAIVLHAGGAWLLLGRIRGMVDNLTFSATRRTLARRPPGAEHGGLA